MFIDYVMVLGIAVILLVRIGLKGMEISISKTVIWLAYLGLILYFCLMRPEIIQYASNGSNQVLIMSALLFALSWFSWLEGLFLGLCFYLLLTPNPIVVDSVATRNIVIAVVLFLVHLMLGRYDSKNRITKIIAWIWGGLLSFFYALLLTFSCGVLDFKGLVPTSQEPVLTVSSFLVFLASYLLSRREAWFDRTQ